MVSQIDGPSKYRPRVKTQYKRVRRRLGQVKWEVPHNMKLQVETIASWIQYVTAE